MERSLRWLHLLTRPMFLGEEQIPAERPLLFVGNHTLAGIVDVPQLFFRLYREHGIFLRSLGEKAHWGIPVWRDLLTRFGAVDGNRENASALFEAGHSILVFPGGAREAFKTEDQRYQLLWGKRVGFARLALRHGVTIQPFATVGADDVWHVLADQREVLDSPLGTVLRMAGFREEIVPPLMRGQGPLGLPGVRRQYFRFLPPVTTRQHDGREDDDTAWEVRRQVEASITAGMQDLLEVRAQDPDSNWRHVVARRLVDRLVR